MGLGSDVSIDVFRINALPKNTCVANTPTFDDKTMCPSA